MRSCILKRYNTLNINAELSVPILADLENVSESHFKSIFKKECGIPPMDYVLRKKIEIANSKLSGNTELSIAEVAFEYAPKNGSEHSESDT